MTATSTNVGASWRPFLAGVVTTATVVYGVMPLVQRRRRKTNQSRHDHTTTHTSAVVRLMDSSQLDQRVVRKAEGAIRKRTSRVTIVVERCTNDHNYSAILRTAEALGVQNVWIIDSVGQTSHGYNNNNNKPPGAEPKCTTQEDRNSRSLHHVFARKAMEWLSVREFQTTASCVEELRRTNHTLWVTDLSQVATCLTESALRQSLSQQHTSSSFSLPPKLAIVFGTEAVGCTQEMLDAADLRVYLPLRGFADSLNLSVATALVVHQLFLLDPLIEGDMTPDERQKLRRGWFAKLAKQRLLTSAEKRNYVRLAAQLKACEALAEKKRNGVELETRQIEKLSKLESLKADMDEIESRLNREAERAVEDLVENPPDPITDMRRPDEHRTWFGGRKTRNHYGELWDNMPATTGYDTLSGPSTSAFFRIRAGENSDHATAE